MKKILIIDEEKWYMEAIFDRIDIEFGPEMYDYVFNGTDAIALLKEKDYAAVILDLMLPLGDGLVLPPNEPDLMYGLLILRKIKEIRPSIAVICYTVLADQPIKNELAKYHATHVHKIAIDSFDKLFRELKKIIK